MSYGAWREISSNDTYPSPNFNRICSLSQQRSDTSVMAFQQSQKVVNYALPIAWDHYSRDCTSWYTWNSWTTLPNTTRNPIKGSYTHSCWKFFEISKTMYFGTKIEPSTTPHPTKKGLFHPFSSTCSLSTTFLSTSLLPHATYSMDLDAHIMHIILLFLSTPLPYYFYNIINSRKHNPYHSSKKKREENFTEAAPFTSSSTWAFTPIHVHLSQVSSGFPSNKYHMYLSLEDLVLLHLMINL